MPINIEGSKRELRMIIASLERAMEDNFENFCETDIVKAKNDLDFLLKKIQINNSTDFIKREIAEKRDEFSYTER